MEIHNYRKDGNAKIYASHVVLSSKTTCKIWNISRVLYTCLSAEAAEPGGALGARAPPTLFSPEYEVPYQHWGTC